MVSDRTLEAKLYRVASKPVRSSLYDKDSSTHPSLPKRVLYNPRDGGLYRDGSTVPAGLAGTGELGTIEEIASITGVDARPITKMGPEHDSRKILVNWFAQDSWMPSKSQVTVSNMVASVKACARYPIRHA